MTAGQVVIVIQGGNGVLLSGGTYSAIAFPCEFFCQTLPGGINNSGLRIPVM